jgi:hypothetical protein
LKGKVQIPGLSGRQHRGTRYEQSNEYKISINNDYSYNPPPVIIETYYNLTVNWVDEDGNTLATSSSSLLAGNPYNAENISGGSGRTFGGFTFKEWDSASDSVTGSMNTNKTVIFVYAANRRY